MNLDAPKHLINLSSSAMIVTVTTHVWTATRQEKSLSNEITAAKRASADSAKVTQNLLAGNPEHKALLNYRQTVYNWLQRLTYDWAGDARLVPTHIIERFMKELGEHKAQFNSLLDNFMNKYQSIVSDAAFKQGDMFDRSAYPEPHIVRAKFYIDEFVSRVPEGDFRNAVFNETAEQLKQHYERQAQQIVDRVMEDAAERLIASAVRISNACTEPEYNEDDGKTKRKKIYETTLTQAAEICDTLKNFNITNNPELEQARVQLEQAIAGVNIEDLRESGFRRAQVKHSVDDMLSKFRPLKVTV